MYRLSYRLKKAWQLGLAESSRIALNRLRKRLYILPPVPPTVYIELTAACNLNCLMCDRKSITRKIGLMDFSLFRHIIDDAVKIGVREIKLNRFGEPLLHPKLVEMVAYAKQAGIPSVFFTSNATLMTEELAQRLIRSGLDRITFSVDGGTPETYESIRRGAKYFQVVANIERFLEVRRRLGSSTPRVIINTIYMRETAPEFAQIFQQWQPKVDRINILPVAKYGNISDHSPFNRQAFPQGHRPCHHLFDRLMIFWDGLVTVCCADINGKLSIGRIQESSLNELWRCPQITRLRELHRRGDFSSLPICAQCDGINKQLYKEMRATVRRLYQQYSRI